MRLFRRVPHVHAGVRYPRACLPALALCVSQLLPGFVISAGTQVVLKVAKVLAGGQHVKPPGSDGAVLESPPDNRQPYLVRFADGQTVEAYFPELALRRREVEDGLGEVKEDLRPYIIYRCQVGSKAFGLSGEDSDDDLRGIYLPPARLHWSLRQAFLSKHLYKTYSGYVPASLTRIHGLRSSLLADAFQAAVAERSHEEYILVSGIKAGVA